MQSRRFLSIQKQKYKLPADRFDTENWCMHATV